MKLRTYAYLLGLLPVTLMTLALGLYLGLSRHDDLETTLRERGDALARHVAQGAEYPVASGNPVPLEALLGNALAERDVVFAGVYRPNGERIAVAGREPPGPPARLTAGLNAENGLLIFTAPVELAPLAVADPFFQSAVPDTPQRIAWVRVVLSRSGNLALARQQILATLGLVTLGMLLAALLVRGLVRSGVEPLMEIITAVRDITGRNFHVRLPTTANSELRALQVGINQMSEALQSYQEDMQGRIDQATAELAHQKEEAERASQAKSRFLAAASHDLRHPMHAIALYVEAMKPQLQGRAAAHTLVKIEAAVVSMETLFCGILDLSRLDAGVVVPEITAVSVPDLLEGLRDDFAREAEHKGLRLRHRSCAARVATDPVLLGRILRNLLSNALRYTDRGGVLIAARRHRDGIRLQVWDTGRGIPPEHLGHIFEEYFQVNNPQRDRTQGLGLGLAIVDRLAHLLGHPLSVRSLPGRGTVFSLDLPISRDTPARDTPARKTLEDMTRLHGQVAIVDDDPMVLDSLDALLTGWGLDVTRARSESELVGRLAGPPDLLITDYRLGAEDGLALARTLHMIWPDAEFATLVMTGDVSEDSLRTLGESGYIILHKPVRPARLRALMPHLLKADAAGPAD